MRSEGASAASVPSTLSVGLTLIEPSNAAFIGAPATRSFSAGARCRRAPRRRSASVMLASTGSSRQMKLPVAPKLLEIDGQASEKSTSLQRLGNDLCARLRSTHGAVVDAHLGEGGDRARCRRHSGCAPAHRSAPDQLDCGRRRPRRWRWSAARATTSAISTRPISSGKKRSRAVSRSAVERRAIGVAEDDVVEADAAGGKQRNGGRAAQDGLKAGDRADLAQDLLRARRPAEIRKPPTAARRRRPRRRRAARNPRRLKPVAAVKGEIPVCYECAAP